MSEKYTYSSLLNNILELEKRVKALYEKLSEESSGTLAEIFREFAVKSEDRINRVNWTRQMTVLEMTLEYITGIPLKRAIEEVDEIIRSKSGPIQKAIKVEEILSKIYKISSDKIGFMSMDASLLLDEMARESSERIKRLIGLQA